VRGRRVLIAACGAHFIQDGLVALQYVLLPILAQAFGLNYAQVGFLRAVSNGAMTLLEIPAGVLSERFGEIRLLVFGLICAGLGYLGVALASGFYLIVAAFLVAGGGAGFQHSLASALIANHFGDAERRRSLGIYNAFGDGGKLAFTAIFSIAIGAGIAWNMIVTGLCLLTLTFAALLTLVLRLRSAPSATCESGSRPRTADNRWGIRHPRSFAWLIVTVFIDSLAQAVFLTFIAFLLLEKGSGETLASMAVVLALCGGMVGKFASGFLAVRYGDRHAFRILQFLTVSGLLLVGLLPVLPILVLLPFVGMVVQGSSTVTYGAISDFVHRDRQSRGYALVYALSGLSAVGGPMLFGKLADLYGVDVSLALLASITSLTLVSGKVLRKSVPLVSR
jgi:MFS family permease